MELAGGLLLACALAGIGAGSWSFDHAAGLSDHGALWAIFALVVGVLGGYGAVTMGREQTRRSLQPSAGNPSDGHLTAA